MGINSHSSLDYWNYFLALERDLENLSRFIEFSEDNFKCYSLEMTRLLFAASSEVDVVAKLICKQLNPSSNADKIDEYRKEIQPSYSNISEFFIEIPRFGLKLQPWDNWNNGKNPLWWNAYNKVKHVRSSYFKMANLKNVLNAVAGLYIFVLYLYKEKAEACELVPMTSLLRVEDKYFGGMKIGGKDLAITYNSL